MTGNLRFGNDRSIGAGAIPTQLEIVAGKVSIRFAPERAVGNDISKCIFIRDTGNGVEYMLATATPPQVYDLPLAAGIHAAGSRRCTYEKDQFGRVFVFSRVQGSGTSDDIANTSILFNLPEGYRPTENILRNAKIVAGGNTYHADLEILVDGRGRILMPYAGNYMIGQFNISFTAV